MRWLQARPWERKAARVVGWVGGVSLLAAGGAGLAAAITTSPSTQTFTYTAQGTTVVVPDRTFTQTVTIPTVTVTTTVGATTTQPTPDTGVVRAAFYYGWFPEAWTQQGISPFTHYHPTLGFYDSSSTAVLDQQIAWMQDAGLNAMIASWWGPGSQTDNRIPTILGELHKANLKLALYYEIGSGTPTSVQSDLDYIAAKYTDDPSYLHRGGKPVLFTFNADGCDNVAKVIAAAQGRFYIDAKVFSGFRTCTAQPDSWHQYGPAVAESHFAGYSFTVSPGFWKANETTPRLARDLARWRTNVADMVASGEPWQLVTTFNEWGEGSSIEPATEWGTDYLNALRDAIANPSPTTTAATTTAPTTTQATTNAATTTAPTTTAMTTTAPTTTAAATAIKHVVFVLEENHPIGSIIGSSSAPYINSLAAKYGLATNLSAETHPSLPNYIALTSGSTQGITDDAGPSSHPLAVDNLFNQMETAGLSWGSFQEHLGTSDYLVRHDPSAYYADLSHKSVDLTKIDVNNLPAFSFVTPDRYDDMHDGTVAQGDTWLKNWLPTLLAGTDYKSGDTLIVVTWDEGNSTDNHVATILINPAISAVKSATAYTHYSILKLTEDLLGVPRLGHAGSAASMRAAFGL